MWVSAPGHRRPRTLQLTSRCPQSKALGCPSLGGTAVPLARVLGAAQGRAAEFITNCCFLYWNSWLQPQGRSDKSLHTLSQHPLCGCGAADSAAEVGSALVPELAAHARSNTNPPPPGDQSLLCPQVPTCGKGHYFPGQAVRG